MSLWHNMAGQMLNRLSCTQKEQIEYGLGLIKPSRRVADRIENELSRTSNKNAGKNAKKQNNSNT